MTRTKPLDGVPDARRATDTELVWLATHRATPVRRRSWRLPGASAVVAVLGNGEVGQMHLTAGADTGASDVAAGLHLPWWGWAVLGRPGPGPADAAAWSVAASLLSPEDPGGPG